MIKQGEERGDEKLACDEMLTGKHRQSPHFENGSEGLFLFELSEGRGKEKKINPFPRIRLSAQATGMQNR